MVRQPYLPCCMLACLHACMHARISPLLLHAPLLCCMHACLPFPASCMQCGNFASSVVYIYAYLSARSALPTPIGPAGPTGTGAVRGPSVKINCTNIIFECIHTAAFMILGALVVAWNPSSWVKP